MSFTVNLYYTGSNGNAKKFVREMIDSGTVEKIKNEEGNLKYAYFFPVDDQETVLLIDSWSSEEALDKHHHSEMMQTIIQLRDKYDLHMRAERYISAQQEDNEFIRK